MKIVKHEIKQVVEVTIFERGDLIYYKRKDCNGNQYGLVLEDQDPNNLDQVKVRDLKTCRDTVWSDVHIEGNWFSKCKFFIHLDEAVVNLRDTMPSVVFN